MMRLRSFGEPTEPVIRAASALLALAVGIGLAFGLWSQLRHVADWSGLEVAVVALGLGLGLIALGLRYPAARIFLAVLGVTLVLAFFCGGHAFTAIAP
jgi:hypothetical protein